MNRHRKPHLVPLPMPKTITDYFLKDRTDLRQGTLIEFRTELLVEKLCYRAHPNYQDSGPWYDWVNVTYETDWDGADHLVQDTDIPVKILGFFRTVDAIPQPFKVLIHPAAFREKDSDVERAETLLLCAWLLETKPNGRANLDAINPDQIQDQILVIEECDSFQDRYQDDISRRVWAVKEMRSYWPLPFRAFAVAEYQSNLPDDDSSEIHSSSVKQLLNRRRSARNHT